MTKGSIETTQSAFSVDTSLGPDPKLAQMITILRTGQTVLDLGCGDGTYSFLAATAVGDSGRVIGVETTPAILAQARANGIESGFCQVSFRLGELVYLPVADQSVDIIISHYGIHRSPGKGQVFCEAFRTLKPGGHLALVDLVGTQVLPEEVEVNEVLDTASLSGLLMLDDLEDLLRAAGFAQIRSQTVCFRQRCVTCYFFPLPQVFLISFPFKTTVSQAI